MFGYEYVNLSPAQVEARRELLDKAGVQAYFTPIVLLVTIYVYRRLLYPLTKQSPSKASDHTKHHQQSISSTRRLRWLLTNTYISEFGPLHVQLLGLVYATYLLYLITRNTGKDYMHVTKAFGHVAVSQLPLHYLLSIKSPWSPITLATGLTHERLNAYHRLFGRIIHLLVAAHAICYLKFFVDIGALSKRLGDWDVRLGLMAFWTVNFLAVFALPYVRAKVYHKVFYRSHVVLSAVLLVVLWYHVPYTRTYVEQAGAVWFLNGILRKAGAVNVDVSCEKASAGGSRLVQVVARVKDGAAGWKQDWVPGMHGYLLQKGLGPKTPFTAVAVTSNGNETSTEVRFVVRDLGGPMTGLLGHTAKTTPKPLELQLEGPYGEAKEYMPDILRAGRREGKILIVAGGVGATYALPIYTAILESRKGQTEGVSLVWIVKDIEDAMWGIQMLRETTSTRSSDLDIQIHVTNSKDTAGITQNTDVQLKGLRILHCGSRPDLGQVVDGVFLSQGRPEKVTVMVCGPGGLSQSLRQEVGRHVTGPSGREVDWFEEQFGFGGS